MWLREIARTGCFICAVGPIASACASADHGAKLNDLAQWFDLVWATTWEHEAPLLIAPPLGLPLDVPVIEFTRGRADETWELHAVRDFMGERPLAWMDDELGSDAYRWAEAREPKTLLVQPQPTLGLVEEHFTLLDSLDRSCRDDT